MSDPTYIACPRCGEPLAMSLMQKRLYHGRTLSCQRCAKPFAVTEETPDPAPMRRRVEEENLPPTSEEPPAQASVQAPHRKSWTPARIALAVGGGIILFVLTLYLVIGPSIERARIRAHQNECGNNLLQLGAGLQAYAAGNGGRFPDSLNDLAAAGMFPAELLVCPATGQANYVYLGKGMSSSGPATQVLIYEPLSNHGGAGANVVYLDGTVQFLSPNAASSAATQPATVPTFQPVTNP